MNNPIPYETFAPLQQGHAPQQEQVQPISATSFVWRDPASIPPRQWLYGRHLIRKFVSVTVAPGGIGKSSLTIAEALCMTTGQKYLGKWIEKPLRVWLWNLEDTVEELDRRIAGACQHYNISEDQIGNRLFVDSGRNQRLKIATAEPRASFQIATPVVESLIREIKAKQIDVLIVDPFVSSHGVSENDNNAIDAVAKEWAGIADICKCSIELVHHTRKASGEAETTADSARGAKALVDASRDTRVLTRMSEGEAEKAGVENHRHYFKVFSDKANLAPSADNSDWYQLQSIQLANGDGVGVVTPWHWPETFEGMTTDDLKTAQQAIHNHDGDARASDQSNDWAGHIIATSLNMDTGRGLTKSDMSREQIHTKSKLKSMLKIWISNGRFKEVEREDSKRNKRKFLEVGEWIS